MISAAICSTGFMCGPKRMPYKAAAALYMTRRVFVTMGSIILCPQLVIRHKMTIFA